MQELLLIRGVPGAGKTTIATMLSTLPNRKIISIDDYFQYENIYDFVPELLRQAHEDCQDRARALLSNGWSVIVHNTFTASWQLTPYIDMALSRGIRYHVILVESGWRNEVQNIHDVPQEIVKRQQTNIEVKP